MQASHVSTPIKSNVSTIFVAIELSQRSWLVTMHCPDKDKISDHKLEGGDHASLLVRIVRVPTPEQEDARRASRERGRLTKEQTAHTSRIKALLRLLGMAVGNPRRHDWLTWLVKQRDWQGQAVPPQIMAEIKREHAR